MVFSEGNMPNAFALQKLWANIKRKRSIFTKVICKGYGMADVPSCRS